MDRVAASEAVDDCSNQSGSSEKILNVLIFGLSKCYLTALAIFVTLNGSWKASLKKKEAPMGKRLIDEARAETAKAERKSLRTRERKQRAAQPGTKREIERIVRATIKGIREKVKSAARDGSRSVNVLCLNYMTNEVCEPVVCRVTAYCTRQGFSTRHVRERDLCDSFADYLQISW